MVCNTMREHGLCTGDVKNYLNDNRYKHTFDALYSTKTTPLAKK